MNPLIIKKLPKAISLTAILFFLLSCAACGYDPLTITGKVVDEEGNALSDVSVWACYSGWGWGKEEEYLVWDKDTCSETVQTDTQGMYAISFKGPVSSRLRARKDGWVQANDYNTSHSQIVMTRTEDHSARLRDAAKQRDLQRAKRAGTETDTDYYCRVVMSGARSVRLHYQDEVMVVSPTLVEDESQTMAMFAVEGSSKAAKAFAKELVLKVNGETQDISFSTYAGGSDCADDLSFVEFKSQGVAAWCDATVELLLPSVKAMFDAKIFTCPEG
jgi:hypothetical protein